MAGYVLAVLAAASVAATGVTGQGELRSSQALPHARTNVVAIAKKSSVGECFVNVKGFRAPKLSAVRKARAGNTCASQTNLAQAQGAAAVGGGAAAGGGIGTGAIVAIGAVGAGAVGLGIAEAVGNSSS